MPGDTIGHPTIEFTVSCEGNEHRVCAYPNEYRDLRELIVDKFNLETFGQCGGNGRCATCMVQINSAAEELSCRVPVDDELANSVVVLAGNYY